MMTNGCFYVNFIQIHLVMQVFIRFNPSSSACKTGFSSYKVGFSHINGRFLGYYIWYIVLSINMVQIAAKAINY